MPPHLERDATTSTISSDATVTQLKAGTLAVGYDGARSKMPAQALGQTQPTKQSNKRSWDYILKTGAAGGLAGCAVSPNGSKQRHAGTD